jgi:hypothetical protein
MPCRSRSWCCAELLTSTGMSFRSSADRGIDMVSLNPALDRCACRAGTESWNRAHTICRGSASVLA